MKLPFARAPSFALASSVPLFLAVAVAASPADKRESEAPTSASRSSLPASRAAASSATKAPAAPAGPTATPHPPEPASVELLQNIARADEEARATSSVATPRVLVAPDFGFVVRPAKETPGGIHYGTGFAYGAHVQMLLLSWLRASLFYVRTSQSIEAPIGALTPGAASTFDGSLTGYALGTRLQPTWSVFPNLHLWLDAGAAWGTAHAPKVHLGATPPFDLAPRDGVFIELPVGLGGAWDIDARWVSLTFDATFSPMTDQSGDMGDSVQSLQGGTLVHSAGMPRFAWTLTTLLGLAIRL